ncbi:hypothetical protein J3R82DRAFT_11378 [Butyriboletus roseoflavus]|nr:hypothetical protein J3R82DRAFT_11378 [Butyriboletus roseoflavus]
MPPTPSPSQVSTALQRMPSLEHTPTSGPSFSPRDRSPARPRTTYNVPRALALARPLRPSSRGTTQQRPLSIPQANDPRRTSPKLDLNDPELGLSATTSIAGDQAGPPTSLFVLPLTPPDRCYLAPIPTVTDCPYGEPWPTNIALDGKLRLPGSPLKVSINTDPAFPASMVGPMDYLPPGPWSPTQIWTSTPCKNDISVPIPVLSPYDHHTRSTMNSSALANISHALISRSRSSVQPYDASNSSTSSDASPSINTSLVVGTLQRPDPAHECDPTHAQVPPTNQPHPQFHYPDAYACAWRRHGARVPGKPGRTAYTRSHSHMDLPASEWYDADAYAPSPVSVLSPPRCESATETEDEDEIPLYRLRERLARRSAAVGAGMGNRTAVSPRTRRMSEGCILAISESTPTRIGVSTRAGRKVLSLALNGGGYSSKDWLEALSLYFSSERKDPLAPVPKPCMAPPSVDRVAVTG